MLSTIMRWINELLVWFVSLELLVTGHRKVAIDRNINGWILARAGNL